MVKTKISEGILGGFLKKFLMNFWDNLYKTLEKIPMERKNFLKESMDEVLKDFYAKPPEGIPDRGFLKIAWKIPWRNT